MIIQIESLTTKGKFYDVDTQELTCSCPAFTNRRRFGKVFCKHITLMLEQKTKENNPVELISTIREDSDVVRFINKFGEEKLNYLKTTGQVFETHGRIIILE
jgi:hypothetical protein